MSPCVLMIEHLLVFQLNISNSVPQDKVQQSETFDNISGINIRKGVSHQESKWTEIAAGQLRDGF